MSLFSYGSMLSVKILNMLVIPLAECYLHIYTFIQDLSLLCTILFYPQPNHYLGSHVVIRSTNNNLPTDHYETLKDAALLAAVNSKASSMGKVPVTYTRCRNVSKPVGGSYGDYCYMQ